MDSQNEAFEKTKNKDADRTETTDRNIPQEKTDREKDGFASDSEVPSEDPLLDAARIQFLPLGSVITIHSTPRRMMIVGRIQKDINTGAVYEYSAVPWPEGMISSRRTFLVRQKQIERVLFVGMQDEQEFEFRALLEDTWPQVLKEAGQD
ncbi:DUF4176 domain-containing protein [Allobaculum mucilyticum]|uniref:DUF4176 domain-containing protein n=1 Tax=Allobaculum mucilyticum TaxID=2834459 RepID=UPI001E379287|nr:DUF4176 domain-containing protein [Allobaculum mucilyticum]UNT96653.1 DUF4176 domain-containing protein [Allobaculum mucilyticum]